MQVVYITTDATGGQQQAAYVYAAPGSTYPAVQPAYPTGQTSYPPAQTSYPPTQGDHKPSETGQPGLYPNLGPSVQAGAPPSYTEKGQAYW